MENHAMGSETATLPLIAEHIVMTPGVCGGKPRIAGHRITVQHIVVWHERGGMSPDEIASRHPGITLGDVYAALTYYHDHKDAIRASIAADEVFADALRAQSPSLLQKKLADRHGQDDSLSS
jgi:uncharacterized protein (DUF433 family)